MKCPIDDAQLVMSERSGIEIDYCPQCRGVWLDRGELDKIIERSVTPTRSVPTTQPYREDRPRRDDDHDVHRDSRELGSRPKRKESWLSELFD